MGPASLPGRTADSWDRLIGGAGGPREAQFRRLLECALAAAATRGRRDGRFGFRMLLKNPVFTLVAIATLAFAIGGNTAIFTMVNALLLRPLDGVSDPGRLVQLGRQYTDRTAMSDSSYPDFLDYRAGNTTMSGLAAISPNAFHVSARGATERLEGELVAGDYFSLRRVRDPGPRDRARG